MGSTRRRHAEEQKARKQQLVAAMQLRHSEERHSRSVQSRVVQWFRHKVERHQPASDNKHGHGHGHEHRQKHRDMYNTVRYMLPVLCELDGYSWRAVGADVLAAVTVTLVVIPQALAYASLAHVDPINALLSAAYPVFIYAVFGSSRQLSVGPEALSSVLVGIAVVEASEATGISTTILAGTLTFIVGLFTLILAFLRAGFIDNILSGYLLTGFVTGVAVLIITEQLPGLLGLDYHHPKGEVSTLQKLISTGESFYTANIPSVVIGLLNVVFLITIQRIKKYFSPRWKKYGNYLRAVPEVFILVSIMLIISATADLNNKFKVKTLGKFENAVIPPAMPLINGELFQRFLQPAIIIVIVGFIESQSVTRNFGLKNNYFPSGDRELFALGASNFVGSFLGAYVTFGSLPRSRILANAGGKTTLSGIYSSILVFCSILTLGPVLAYLPKPTLAAIVFVAAYNLIEWGEIFFVFRLKGWTEIFFMVATFVITFVAPISNGIILCLIFAALVIVRHSAHLDLVILGRLPIKQEFYINDNSSKFDINYTSSRTDIACSDKNSSRVDLTTPTATSPKSISNTSQIDIDASLQSSYPQTSVIHVRNRYSDIKEHPDAILFDNILIVGIESPLLFYNVGGLRRALESLLITEKAMLYKKISQEAALASAVNPEVTIVVGDAEEEMNKDRERRMSHLGTVQDLLDGAKEDCGGEDVEKKQPVVEKKEDVFNIIFSFKYCTDMDSAAAHILRSIVRSFLKRNTRICFTNLHIYHIEVLDNAGIIELIGTDNVFASVDSAVCKCLGE